MKRFKLFLTYILLATILFPNTLTATSLCAPPASKNLVPVRTVGESLAYKVIWDQKSKSATISNGDTSVTLSPGINNYKVSGQPSFQLQEPPTIVDGVIFVPAEFWSCAFGLDVNIQDGNLTIKKPEV